MAEHTDAWIFSLPGYRSRRKLQIPKSSKPHTAGDKYMEKKKKRESWIWKYFYSVAPYNLILCFVQKISTGICFSRKSLLNLATNCVLSANLCYFRDAQGWKSVDLRAASTQSVFKLLTL